MDNNPHLEMLKKVQSLLMQMHRLLMASQKSDLEAETGKTVTALEWMQLMMTEERFAWMKSMLTLMSDIDALMDNYTVSEKELHIIRQDSELLFLTGDGTETDFFFYYKQVVQKDPDVIMFHGHLRNSIRALPASEKIEETSAIRRNWHVKPKNFH